MKLWTVHSVCAGWVDITVNHAGYFSTVRINTTGFRYTWTISNGYTICIHCCVACFHRIYNKVFFGCHGVGFAAVTVGDWGYGDIVTCLHFGVCCGDSIVDVIFACATNVSHG